MAQVLSSTAVPEVSTQVTLCSATFSSSLSTLQPSWTLPPNPCLPFSHHGPYPLNAKGNIGMWNLGVAFFKKIIKFVCVVGKLMYSFIIISSSKEKGKYSVLKKSKIIGTG
jgi:hypothetical protein